MSSSPHIDTSFILLMENVSAAYYKDYVAFDLEFFYNNFQSIVIIALMNGIILFFNINPFFLPKVRLSKRV